MSGSTEEREEYINSDLRPCIYEREAIVTVNHRPENDVDLR